MQKNHAVFFLDYELFLWKSMLRRTGKSFLTNFSIFGNERVNFNYRFI